MTDIRRVQEAQAILGEGPAWDAAADRLYWFDIKGRRLHWLTTGGETGAYDLPVRASVATPRRSGGLVIVAEDGLSTFDPSDGSMTLIEPVEVLEPVK